MKLAALTAALVFVVTPALAQSSPTQGSQVPQPNQSNQANGQSSRQGMAAAQKIKQDLQKEGFTDVKVVAESFVVQGKSPDGNPVLMTIGPQGMSVFEAMGATGTSSGTVGSNEGSSRNSNTPSPNASANSNSPAQPK